MHGHMSIALLAIAAAFAGVWAAPEETGNCQSGRYFFNATSRLYGSWAETVPDVTQYDFVTDYGFSNVKQTQHGLALSLTSNEAGQTASGARVSSTRYMLYGKVTVRMAAIPVRGAVTTFITMSRREDEIDWEFLGSDSSRAQTNVFFKGIPEYNVHAATVDVGRDGIAAMHDYTVDWRKSRITWSIDGRVVRTFSKDDPDAQSPMTPKGERWFPSTAAQVQLAVWDGGSNAWAGGPMPWTGQGQKVSAHFEYMDIQCYDDADRPVPLWPPGTLASVHGRTDDASLAALLQYGHASSNEPRVATPAMSSALPATAFVSTMLTSVFATVLALCLVA